MTFTPPALVAMLPPTWLEPLDAKSTGQVSPCGGAVLVHRLGHGARLHAHRGAQLVDRIHAPHARERQHQLAVAPRPRRPRGPVRPPDGTTATRCALHSASRRDTSSVVRGNAIAAGAGAYTRVQSRPYSASSAASSREKVGGKVARDRRAKRLREHAPRS